jgi:hypothetical protein
MNPDLQNQTDQILVWLKSIEATMHQDMILATALICAMLLVVAIVIFIRR